MAKRFPLEMADGTKIRTLEELRANFDDKTVLDYFEDGLLTRWLEDRFYEDEVKALRNIDKNAADYPQALWNALGVDVIVGLDEEAIERLAEKRGMLHDLTDDSTIIARAPQTAFDQEDLAELLDRDENMIYLCGKEFRIPLQPHVTYEGMLGRPKIIVKSNLEQKLKELGIVFVNVELPWGESTTSDKNTTNAKPVAETVPASNKTWLVPKGQLKAMFAKTFKDDFEYYSVDETITILMTKVGSISAINSSFSIVKSAIKVDNSTENPKGPGSSEASTELTDDQRRMAITLICGNEYIEEDLVHLRVSEDMSEGWAMTCDSFCGVNGDQTWVIPYEKIEIDTSVSPRSYS